jgi:hypothetical protein
MAAKGDTSWARLVRNSKARLGEWEWEVGPVCPAVFYR